ncbi:MAG TPA: hypothetical protein DDW30_08390 [Clostridiales bacterium]|nr:hypothetical protein [Clostridiales bacterium]
MNENEQKNPDKRLVTWIIVYAVVFFLIVALSNLSAINSFLARVLDVLAPVLLGLCIAYLINPLFRIFERRVFYRVRPTSLRRTLALLLTYAVVIALIAGLLLLIIPQLIGSIKTFAGSFNSHMDSLVEQLNTVIDWLNARLPEQNGSPAITPLDRATVLKKVNELWSSLMELLKKSMDSGSISRVIAILGQTASVVTDIILAIFISLYVLATKELRYAQVKKLRTAWIPERINATLTRILSIADRSFGGFLRGKLLDSSIVGVLVYLFCLIARVPNPVLIAVIVGITDIIPVIGPFIGVIPSAVIILLTDPIKVIFFLIAILVIQQIDGNIIAPKILGDNTGVSSLCVMIAIIVMGSLWGLVGMIVGVPLFATVLELLKIRIGKRLAAKGLPDETESYYAPDAYAGTPESARGIRPRRKRRNTEASAEATNVTTGAGRLSRTERLNLGTLSLAMRHGLFRDPSDEALEAFAADEAQFLAKINAATQAEEPPVAEPAETAEAVEAEAGPAETVEKVEKIEEAEEAKETEAPESAEAEKHLEPTEAAESANSSDPSDQTEGGADA